MVPRARQDGSVVPPGLCKLDAHHREVAEWAAWTGLEFPGSGSFVIPGALVPVAINLERDQGDYVEPNQWMLHPIEGRRAQNPGTRGFPSCGLP